MAKTLPHKRDIKSKTVSRDKKKHYIMIRGSFYQEDIAMVNVCAPVIINFVYQLD
jgi:hypothetical protein